MESNPIPASALTLPIAAAIGASVLTDPLPLTLLAAAASNLSSNVPAVVLLAPLVEAAGGGRGALLTLAMASTLAGNLTLLASIANLIVAERAARAGAAFTFVAYLRVGVPITAITLALGAWLLTPFAIHAP